jgi:DNA topoisomerase-3
MQLIVAEKPSVARDIARVLGVRGGGRAFIAGENRVITWCVGHLVELDEPAAYDARWKAWRLDTLPMIPERFRLRPVQSSRDQCKAVRELLGDRRFTEVVNACDAGREGELIFRYVYELAGSRLPIRRLWISSMTDEAIRAGFAGLRPGAQYDALADAARCRSEADWLVGLNATRAVTVRHRTGPDSTLYSIGRVQTPTLAIVVEREKAIRAFVPRDYWECKGKFGKPGSEIITATWTRGKATRLGKRELVEAILERDRAQARATDPDGPLVERVEQKKTREPPPLLFDLTSLQRTANRRFGLSASRTLEIAQALYETHKLLTYPRTDSRHLSSDLAAELPKIFRGVGQIEEYAGFVAPLLEKPPPKSKRVFDDSKVQDHHAIIPTGKTARGALGRDEERVFDLVVRRFLGAFYPDAEFANTELSVRVGPAGPGDGPDDREALLDQLPPPPDRYLARGRVRLVAGWQEVAGFGDDAGKDGKDELEQTLPPVKEGDRLDGTFEAVARQTKPPPRHSEATLLSAMETAGRAIEDEALRQAMKDCGLGTPATRAATIETLLKRKFVAREGKMLVPTEPGHGPARRPPRPQPGLARADRELGGAPPPHRPRPGAAHHLHERHRQLRPRGGDRHPRRTPSPVGPPAHHGPPRPATEARGAAQGRRAPLPALRGAAPSSPASAAGAAAAGARAAVRDLVRDRGQTPDRGAARGSRAQGQDPQGQVRRGPGRLVLDAAATGGARFVSE